MWPAGESLKYAKLCYYQTSNRSKKVAASKNDIGLWNVNELRKEFVDTAILAAEKVISEALDKEKHRNLIVQTLQESAAFRRNEG